MANIAKTYTFVNGQPADGTQVNKNFDDIIAGVGDTADLHPVIDSGAQFLNALAGGPTGIDTSLSFPIAANEAWVVDLYAYVVNNTNPGTVLSINAPVGCSIAGFQFGGGPTLASPLVPSLISAINTPCAVVGACTGAVQQVCVEMHFRVVNGSTAGAITLHIAPAVGGDTYIYVGSYWKYRKATGV